MHLETGNYENITAATQHLQRTPSRRCAYPLEQRLENIEIQEDMSGGACGLMLNRRLAQRRPLSDMVDTAVADDDSPRDSRHSDAAKIHERRLERAPKMPRLETLSCTDTPSLPQLASRKSSTPPELPVYSMIVG